MPSFRRLILFSLLLSLLLTSCASFQSPALAWPAGTPPRNPALGTEPVTLHVWFAEDYAQTEPITALVADFESTYPNVTVELRTDVSWEEMDEQVELAVTQGEPPDIAHYHAFAMGARGLAEPLDDLWQAWGTQQEFLPNALEDVLWKAHFYGVPLDINTLFTIYNKRLFKEARLPAPSATWTIDDLEVMAPLLTKPNGEQYALALSSSGWWMSGLINAAGGKLLDEGPDKIVATLNDPQVLRTMQLYRKLGLEDQVATLPPPIVRQTDHAVAQFTSGKVAMFFSGPWDLARIRAEAPALIEDVGTAPLPRGRAADKGGSIQGGGSLFVPLGAQHKELAFEFMKWAVSDPYAKRLALELGRYPVKAHLYDDRALRGDPLLLPFYEQLKTAHPYRLEAYAQANESWENAVRAVFTPGANVQAELQQAQREVQHVIDEIELAPSRKR